MHHRYATLPQPLSSGEKMRLASIDKALMTLEQDYAPYLEQDTMRADVQCMRSWIDACSKQGDPEATEYLFEHGRALLEHMKERFEEARGDLQRIDEESPIGANFNGGQSHRLNQAAETVLHASDTLSELLHLQTTPSKD